MEIDMKKIVFVIVCLLLTISCNNSIAGNNNEIETLLTNEKRTLAQPKTYKGDKFTVSITSDKKDTRTAIEKVRGIPPKYEIINAVSFGCSKLYDGDTAYVPDIKIKKIIKEDTGELSFVLLVRIVTMNSIKFNDTQLVELKLNNGITQSFDCSVNYLNDPENLGTSLHMINCMSEVFIKDIYTMRLQSSNANVLITSSDNNFSFALPAIFFTYLNDI